MEITGLWISPENERIPVVEHLIAIQQDPEAFGLTRRDVERADVGMLRSLAERLISEGWIRYRYFGGMTHAVEMHRLDPSKVDMLLADAEAIPTEEVVVETQRPRRRYSGTVSTWFDRTMLRSWKSNPRGGWRLSR